MVDEEPARKRARTEESQTSAQSSDAPVGDNVGVANGVRVKTTGAAALKPSEVAMEQIAGKKKSKFWVYAVEPASEQERPPSMTSEGVKDLPAVNGHSYQNSGMDLDNWDSHPSTSQT